LVSNLESNFLSFPLPFSFDLTPTPTPPDAFHTKKNTLFLCPISASGTKKNFALSNLRRGNKNAELA
jgi:hypothetical protein